MLGILSRRSSILWRLAGCYVLQAVSSAHPQHACARVAETQAGRPFVSVCAGGGHAALHEARLFVCLPLASSQQPPPRPGLDVLSRTLSPDAFVGQLQLQGAPTGDAKYALDFEEAFSLARPASGPAYACTRAVAVGLEPGELPACLADFRAHARSQATTARLWCTSTRVGRGTRTGCRPETTCRARCLARRAAR